MVKRGGREGGGKAPGESMALRGAYWSCLALASSFALAMGLAIAVESLADLLGFADFPRRPSAGIVFLLTLNLLATVAFCVLAGAKALAKKRGAAWGFAALAALSFALQAASALAPERLAPHVSWAAQSR
jgi:hypothetical protein